MTFKVIPDEENGPSVGEAVENLKIAIENGSLHFTLPNGKTVTADIDRFLTYYDTVTPVSGKNCLSITPVTFLICM